jgi:hypothetical protein
MKMPSHVFGKSTIKQG